MALKSCRECKREVSTDAKTCPHCGAPRPTEPKRNTGRYWLALAVVLVFAILLSGRDSARDRALDPQRDDAATVQVICQEAIRRQLKSPTSSDFADVQARATGKGRTYVVTGTVTAVNAFNAPLTKPFLCEADAGAARVNSASIVE